MAYRVTAPWTYLLAAVLIAAAIGAGLLLGTALGDVMEAYIS